MMKIIKVILITSIIFLTSIEAEAVKKEFKLSKINYEIRSVGAQDSNISGLDRSKLKALGKPQNWGVVSVTYASIPKWADDVEIRYFVLLKNKRGKKKTVMLSGSIIYMHVGKRKKHFSSIYASPQALNRYGEVVRIRAEIWYNGVLQDSIQWPRKGKKVPWWTRIKPISGSLINRYYTPFEHEHQLREDMIKIQ